MVVLVYANTDTVGHFDEHRLLTELLDLAVYTARGDDLIAHLHGLASLTDGFLSLLLGGATS